jgi:hypothetical protein
MFVIETVGRFLRLIYWGRFTQKPERVQPYQAFSFFISRACRFIPFRKTIDTMQHARGRMTN